MRRSAETDLYVKGQDLQLDKKYSEYKKLNLWRGVGLSRALSKEEGDSLIDLWNKDQRTPWRLTVQDVSILVELSARISLYRINLKREKARLRKERSREKMRNAARAGDPEACRKIKKIKIADRKRVAKYYELKRKSKRKISIGAKKVRVKRKKTRT